MAIVLGIANYGGSLSKSTSSSQLVPLLKFSAPMDCTTELVKRLEKHGRGEDFVFVNDVVF